MNLTVDHYGRIVAKAEQLGLFGQRQDVKEPGKFGGHYWVDKHGKVRYGEKHFGGFQRGQRSFATEKEARAARDAESMKRAEAHTEREKREGMYQRLAAAESDQGGEAWMARRRAAKEVEGKREKDVQRGADSPVGRAMAEMRKPMYSFTRDRAETIPDR